MIWGSLIHIGCNLVAMHHIPFASLWFVDSKLQPKAIYSAACVVIWLFVGLVCAMVVFSKGMLGSTSWVKTTTIFQFFMDPINAALATVSMFLQIRNSKRESATRVD
jgi:hypothetical protein